LAISQAAPAHAICADNSGRSRRPSPAVFLAERAGKALEGSSHHETSLPVDCNE
jgi:hypothetical protein